MLAIIEQNRAAIADLCRRFHVKRLELFGSAARNDFDQDQSDLDFLVLYERSLPKSPDQFFGLQAELEKLLSRKVDLVDIEGAANPYFVAEALRNRIMLYAA